MFNLMTELVAEIQIANSVRERAKMSAMNDMATDVTRLSPDACILFRTEIDLSIVHCMAVSVLMTAPPIK